MKLRNRRAGMLLGGAVLALAFFGCAAGGAESLPVVAVAEEGERPRPDPLVEKKCSRCHNLGRVYAVITNSGDWVKTVVVMSGKEQGWISGQEMENLATCTVQAQDTKPQKTAIPPEPLPPPRVLFEAKCSRCHGLERAYAVIHDPLTWAKTVLTMRDKDREWLAGDTLQAVISYRQRHREYVEVLFAGTCGTCHRWGEMLTMRKTVSQWRTSVNYMARRCAEGLAVHEREAIYNVLAFRNAPTAGY